MTQVKHTPLPWRVEPETTLIWSVIDADDIGGFKLPLVKSVEPKQWQKGQPSYEERETNAQFICKAVNEYYQDKETIAELLGALKFASEIIEHYVPKCGGNANEELKSLISKIEGAK